MNRKSVIRLATLIVAATTTSWAFAQPMPQMPMGQGMMGCPMMGMMGQDGMQGMMGQGMGMGMPGMMGQGMTMGGNMGPQVEGRLAYLKAELGITEAQAASWKQYEDVIRSRTSAMQGMRQEMMKAMQAGTVADRMKARITMMEGMVANMKTQSAALESLYKVLTDEQEKKADQLLGMGMM